MIEQRKQKKEAEERAMASQRKISKGSMRLVGAPGNTAKRVQELAAARMPCQQDSSQHAGADESHAERQRVDPALLQTGSGLMLTRGRTEERRLMEAAVPLRTDSQEEQHTSPDGAGARRRRRSKRGKRPSSGGAEPP